MSEANQDVVKRFTITGRFIESYECCEPCCFKDKCRGPSNAFCNGMERDDGKCGHYKLVSSVPDMPNIPPPPDKLAELQAVNAELLAALEAIVAIVDSEGVLGCCSNAGIIDKASAAIAKAKGLK